MQGEEHYSSVAWQICMNQHDFLRLSFQDYTCVFWLVGAARNLSLLYQTAGPLIPLVLLVALEHTTAFPKMKETVKNDAPQQVRHLQFGVLSKEEIQGLSLYEAVQSSLYAATTATSRETVEGGVLDRRLVSLFRWIDG